MQSTCLDSHLSCSLLQSLLISSEPGSLCDLQGGPYRNCSNMSVRYGEAVPYQGGKPLVRAGSRVLAGVPLAAYALGPAPALETHPQSVAIMGKNNRK